jgi:hypothetical protein
VTRNSGEDIFEGLETLSVMWLTIRVSALGADEGRQGFSGDLDPVQRGFKRSQLVLGVVPREHALG